MVIYIFALIVLCFVGFKAAPKGHGFDDYMSVQKTTSIKGVFVLVVLLSHMRGYITLSDSFWDSSFNYILNCIGQLMVVPFLFYSGYGVAQSLVRKPNYVETIPKKRVLSVWLHFVVVIILFLLANLAIGKTFELKRIAQSLIAWNGVNNSYWYIFCVIIMYLFTWISFLIAKKRMILGASLVTVMTVAYIVIIYLVRPASDHFWWDTALCYPLGIWYSIAKERIDLALLQSPVKRLLAAAGSLAAFLGLWLAFHQTWQRTYFIFCALAFALFIAFISMSFSFANNKILFWSGKRIFSIYTLQRLPMILLSHFGVFNNRYLYSAVAIVLVIIIAEVFERLIEKADKKLGL